MQMYPIPTICACRNDGGIKPLYVELEVQHKLTRYKIIECKETTPSDRRSLGFYYDCKLENDLEIKMQFSFAQHKWLSNTIILE